MDFVIQFFIATFAGTFVFGWRRSRSTLWSVVDLIYYPLGAIGVVLLFLSTDIQRETLQATQLAEDRRIKLNEHLSKRPQVEIHDVSLSLDEHIENVHVVRRWHDICSDGGPSTTDPRCLAVRKLGPLLVTFLQVATKGYTSHDERILETCKAADALIENISKTKAISTIVADRLTAAYTRSREVRGYILSTTSVISQAMRFREETSSYVEQIHRQAFPDPSQKDAQLLRSILMAEIQYGGSLLYALLPCTAADRPAIGALINWKQETQSKEDDVRTVERLVERLRAEGTRNARVNWLHLNFWPYILVFALSLKFGKGVASLRSTRNAP